MSVETSQWGLVTNATGFAGPPAVQALHEAGFSVLAHDVAFADPALWDRFCEGRDRLLPLTESAPERVIEAALAQAPSLAVLVSNDHHPAPFHALEDAPLAALQANVEKLVAFPFGVIQAVLPAMKAQGGGNIVMITSNRARLPLPGAAFPDAARAAANALVRSLAIDCAPFNIVVNAVAPNFLYSEAYYPAALFRETETGRAYIEQSVPVGRLAEPHEIGEVIAFLASVKTRFLTGAIIDFSGGWPSAPPRPSF